MCPYVDRLLFIVFLSFPSLTAITVDDPSEKQPEPQPDRLRHPGLSDIVIIPDNKTILTAGNDGIVRFWEIGSGRQQREVRLQGFTGPSQCASLSRDGKTLVAKERRNLQFWEVASGKQLQMISAPQSNLGYLH